jgi:CRISPR-associated protein Cas5h
MAIAFEISGPFAMFRRSYTTTSSISFPFPPPTSIAGLLAAITGYGNGSDKEGASASYWEKLSGTRIAISILNVIQWHSSTVNFWNVKNPQKNSHIQVKHQFVSKPRYRIYVQGGVEENLRLHLENGTFIYTPYLGVAYALADICYNGQFSWEPIEEQPISLDCVLPQVPGQSFVVDIIASQGIFQERLPFKLSARRALEESLTVLYPTSPENKIHLHLWEGLDVTRYRDSCLAWFPAW